MSNITFENSDQNRPNRETFDRIRDGLGAESLKFHSSDRENAERFLTYLKLASEFEFVQECQEFVRNCMDLKTTSSVLDVGCGFCPDISRLCEKIPQGTIQCLDPQPLLLEQAQENYSRLQTSTKLNLICSDASQIPLENKSVDASRTMRVLQHVEDPISILLEMQRVTRAGCSIVAIEPDWTSLELRGVEFNLPYITQILNTARGETLQPAAGKQLRSWFEVAGIQDTREVILPFRSGIFEQANFLIGFTRRLEQGVALGSLEENQAAETLHKIQELFRSGQLQALLNFHLVYGRASAR